MVRPDIQGTFQCSAFQSITHVIFKSAVGSKVVLANSYCGLAELQIFRSESEQGLSDFYIRYLFHF